MYRIITVSCTSITTYMLRYFKSMRQRLNDPYRKAEGGGRAPSGAPAWYTPPHKGVAGQARLYL